MLERIIKYSLHHKLIVLLFTFGIIGFGLFSLFNISIGAVPDVTNNQVQVITTTRNLSTQDVEQFITYPVELEMSNLPGVKEIRSVSKFGLSVVTIVFEDNMGSYLPRQLISEKIKSAEEKIPEGFGSPYMGPITTGLGEIYQYILDVEPAYRDQYSIMELRTIQDWIVKRQLSGIPGVVEVNTWGGYLKQYEVAIEPQRLRAMGLTVLQVFDALEANNSVAGGGYIEKNNESYFIRGEGLIHSLEDVRDIVVENRAGMPITIRDVAEVHFGSATRFGAITANGEGEKVLGQVMMLKDANSKAVIDRVKSRVAEVQKTLPPGVFINPILDRSELIAKTTATVSENLILGCLIVIFVVVLLLGNLRSGLVVASVIPLSLLFALSLMSIFGVDANLMSLGAIDFGIIIDGAVIIVEYIAYKVSRQGSELVQMPRLERQHAIDQITFRSTNKMMRSAIFGQVIIIIVFIPILSLSDVEGKMFSPMALTFCFALIGAMLLCFTYVPVAASLFLKPSTSERPNISQRLIAFLEAMYRPTVVWALRQKGIVLGLAVLLLIGAGVIFSRMGAEFVPTLDEGDFVIQPVLKTGTSLTKTIETTTQIEQILLTFPEVDQVVTRIGAAEVPTDPMSMEESDVIITLHPPHEWVTAQTKDGLADAFKEALTAIPGIDYEFTQPIEMRFNELITGVRADLAIKIFGPDLAVLNRLGQQINTAIAQVEGASDVSVEKITGLPQMMVQYHRSKIAKYGLSIADVNKILTMNFAGRSAGSVFEGEKQFDLVVRFQESARQEIEQIRNTYVPLPNGREIPLSELASIEYSKGPAKISRDDTKRRMVVGVNVRNRDLESVVKDVQAIIDEQIKLPVGYSVSYGGQFENLRNARARLMVAVPIALLLIFLMLYFAFQSARDALMVFSAIPLAAIGGILLLYFRGMPFSISAGVGFIALFGIAVLNGLVLIEHFKELKEHGMHNLNRRILLGTQQRMRPVLLTAAAAALGFLPMAISTSAGAEVQRPLATVVIGGLVSSTLLTLIVLPVLYALADTLRAQRKGSMKLLTMLPILFGSLPGITQTPSYDLPELISLAETHNLGIKKGQLQIEQRQQQIQGATDLEKTNFFLGYDQNNIALNNSPLWVAGFQQDFRLPGIYRARQSILQQQVNVQQQQVVLDRQRLALEVSKAYYSVLYWQEVQQQYGYLDSLFQRFASAATKKYEAGETNYLEQLTATTYRRRIQLKLNQSTDEISKAYQQLAGWLQLPTAFEVRTTALEPLESEVPGGATHPGLVYYQMLESVANQRIILAEKQFLPDFQVEYFLGSNTAENAQLYHGFQLGVAVPLWRKALRSEVEVARIEQAGAQLQTQQYQRLLESQRQQLGAMIQKYEKGLAFYQNGGRQLGQEILRTATAAFTAGEIDFMYYIQAIEQAKDMELEYLEQVLQYNLAVLDLRYLID